MYDFSRLDDMVNNLCDMGIEPWFTYTKNGNPIYAYYIPTYVADEKDFDFHLTLEVSNYETDNPIKNPVYIDMMNGNVFEIDEIDNVRDHISKFKNLPIKDYPIVVCDKSLIDIE